MQEHQHIEWKESWHTDYFKWVCGFANAQGGTLFIHKIAPPVFSIEPPDFQVELIRYSDNGLKKMGMKVELRKIVLYIQKNYSINNSEVQSLCDVSKATATRYLGELEGKLVGKIGTTGVGTEYVLKGLSKGSIIYHCNEKY